MSDAEDVMSLREALVEATDIVVNAGLTKPIQNFHLQDKENIAHAVALHYTLLQSVAEMDQLMEGLNIEPFRLVDQMKRQSELFVPLFTCKETVSLTAGTDNEIV